MATGVKVADKLKIGKNVEGLIIQGIVKATDMNVSTDLNGEAWNNVTGEGESTYFEAENYEHDTVAYKRIQFPLYTMAYDANGGSGSMTDEGSPYHRGDTVNVLENTLTAPSKTFFRESYIQVFFIETHIHKRTWMCVLSFHFRVYIYNKYKQNLTNIKSLLTIYKIC